jgi:hypothetical protein
LIVDTFSFNTREVLWLIHRSKKKLRRKKATQVRVA